MQKISLFLSAVHDIVHDLPMKSNYSEPKIFTGGIKISEWNRLPKKEQDVALTKDWYVYYSFRNPNTGKFKRQSNVKLGANRKKTKEERFEFLLRIQQLISILLKKGFNPYQDNSQLTTKVLGAFDKPQKIDIVQNSIEKDISKKDTEVQVEPEVNEMNVRQSFEFGLINKINVLSQSSYNNYKNRILRFLKWHESNYSPLNGISTINKKILNDYLNYVLESSGATNRNNTRADLSSLIQLLVDNEIMTTNFIKSISVLKSKPERNKTYSVQQENDILKYLETNDPTLLLYIQFISFNFLRPIEVNRLKIDDLDLEGKKLFVRAKNKAVKVKIIPQKIIDLLPDFSKMNRNHYLFTMNGIGGEWETEENSRRGYFSNKFKLVKDQFGMDKNYGLYSFRHTSITNLYKELSKSLTPFETKSRLMQITGHQTMVALEKYLREIDAALPDDYSHLLK